MKILLVLLFFIIIHGFKLNRFLFNKYTNKVFKNSKLITCNDDCDIFIILFPGYGKNPDSYYELCSKILKNARKM